jgi:hypothetical protein
LSILKRGEVALATLDPCDNSAGGGPFLSHIRKPLVSPSFLAAHILAHLLNYSKQYHAE